MPRFDEYPLSLLSYHHPFPIDVTLGSVQSHVLLGVAVYCNLHQNYLGRHSGHADLAPPFTFPCEGREAR